MGQRIAMHPATVLGVVLATLAAVLGAGVAGATAGEREVVTEIREVRGFDKVALAGVGTLIIEQGRSQSLTVEAEVHVLPRIATDVQNGRLTIRPERSFRTTAPITYRLTVTDLRAVKLSGAARVEARTLVVKRLRLVADGSGGADLGGLDADALEVSVGGSADVVIAGTVDTQNVEVRGSGSYRAMELASREATIRVRGAGEAVVRVSGELTARASGSGRIAYVGRPHVRQKISGNGEVERIG